MTKYGQDAIDYWKDKTKRRKLIKRTLFVVVAFVIGYAWLINVTG